MAPAVCHFEQCDGLLCKTEWRTSGVVRALSAPTEELRYCHDRGLHLHDDPSVNLGDDQKHGSGLLQRVQPFCFVRSQLHVAGFIQCGGRELLVLKYADG